MPNALPLKTGPLKLGVAGVGVMGRNHARVAADMREFDLTTLFDPDAVTAEGVAAAYGAAPVTTAEAFIDAGLDAAVVATPNRFHADVGVEAVGRGDHGRVQPGVDEGLCRRDRRGPVGGGHALGRHGVGIEQGRQVELAHVGGDPGMVAAHDADAGHAELEGASLQGEGVRHGINLCRRRRRR